jgi:hypothetical protein
MNPIHYEGSYYEDHDLPDLPDELPPLVIEPAAIDLSVRESSDGEQFVMMMVYIVGGMAFQMQMPRDLAEDFGESLAAFAAP